MATHLIGSTSSSLTDSKKDLGTVDNQARWDSLKTFLYLAGTFSSCNLNFGVFSGVVDAGPMWLFLFFTVFIGIPYMCMDLFIKQYTGKIDLNESLIPLLKGVNCAIMLQSGVWTLVHACDLSEAVLYFLACMMSVPPWITCQSTVIEEGNCSSMLNITTSCDNKVQIPEKYASFYLYYRQMFLTGDKAKVTRRIFFIALVWIINFFITTLSELMLVKFFKLSFIFRMSLSIFFIIYVGISTSQHLLPAFKNIISHQDYNLINSLGQVMYPFGVGLVGVYDFGSMSPFATVDTAVVVYGILFILVAFSRSIIVRILYNLVSKCVALKEIRHYHYIVMAIIPIGSMFVKLQRLIMILIFLIIITTLSPHMAAITYTIAKLLHSEFRSVKSVYFSGLLSFFGFILTSILALYIHFPWVTDGLRRALFTCMVILAFKRITIIMYIYGVQKFASDVHFWLGFKPALYWIVTWSLMPAVLFYCVIVAVLHLMAPVDGTHSVLWRVWVGTSLLVVLIITLKTIARYASHNKLLAVLRPSHRYGPPDADERKRRKRYDETVTLRQCIHNCVLLDDRFDCTHIPWKFRSKLLETMKSGSELSMNNIFEAETVRKSRLSDMVDAHLTRD